MIVQNGMMSNTSYDQILQKFVFVTRDYFKDPLPLITICMIPFILLHSGANHPWIPNLLDKFDQDL